MPLAVKQMFTLADPRGPLGVDRVDQQMHGPATQHLRQWIDDLGRRYIQGWKRDRFMGTLMHGGVLLPMWAVEGAFNTPKVRRLFQKFIHRFWLYLVRTLVWRHR